MNEFDTAHHEGMSARLALGRALREMHKRSNRTLRAVERDISISDSTLSRYFRGKAVPSWPTVEKICASFGEDAESVRHLWAVAIAERSNADFPAAAPDAEVAELSAGGGQDGGSSGDGRGIESGDRIGWLRTRIGQTSRSRATYLVAGLVLGFALGVGAALGLQGGGATAPPSSGRTAAAGAASVQNQGQGQGVPVPTATGTYCPWKYVVTDGNADDVRVYDDPQRDSIIARYAPGEVFYAAEPPQIVNNMLKTEHGWIGMGNWVQRYTGATCRTGGG